MESIGGMTPNDKGESVVIVSGVLSKRRGF
jgi:hypothetical protein